MGNSEIHTLANSVDPDEIDSKIACWFGKQCRSLSVLPQEQSNLGFHCLLEQVTHFHF